MRLRANSTWAMLEFVFNGMVLLLGLQLPGFWNPRWWRRKPIRTSKPGCCLPTSS
jgi:preprotein translocase subunit Sec63